jgi:hypothetical protein
MKRWKHGAAQQRDGAVVAALFEWELSLKSDWLPSATLCRHHATGLAAHPERSATWDISVERVLKYLELKSGYSDDGPAWIAKVGVSKSGRTVYFQGKALKELPSKGVEMK